MFRFSRALITSCLLISLGACSGALAAPVEFHAAVAGGNPALWYKFNEPVGATTVINYGSLGSSFNGTFPNSATLNAPTLGGDSAYQFVGSASQYVESLSPAPAGFTGNPTFSAEALVYITANTSSSGGYSPFLHWGAAQTGRSVFFSLHRFNANRYYAGFYNGGMRTECSLYRTGRWHHIVWTREGGGSALQGTRLYINGEEVAIQQDTDLPGAPTINVTSTTFRVQRGNDFSRYFSGSVDEIALYPRVLSTDEVRAHYAALGTGATVNCQADFNADCVVDLFDYLDFVDLFASGNIAADYNHDEVVDFFDYLDFVAIYSVGC